MAKNKGLPAAGRKPRQLSNPQHRAMSRGRSDSTSQRPDFGTWFHLTGPQRIQYEVRTDANFQHDLAYLTSYIHDARTLPSLVRLVGGTLRIELERDCWELFRLYDQLVVVPSVLEISPVLNIEWKFQHRVLKRLLSDRRSELWIAECTCDKATNFDGTAQSLFHIRGAVGFWSLSAQMAPQSPRIRLRDTQTPVGPASQALVE